MGLTYLGNWGGDDLYLSFSSCFPFPLSPFMAKLPRQIHDTFSSLIFLISSFFSQSFFFLDLTATQENSDSLSPIKFSLDIVLVWFSHPFSLAGSSFSFSPLCEWAFAPGFILNTCCPEIALYNPPLSSLDLPHKLYILSNQ